MAEAFASLKAIQNCGCDRKILLDCDALEGSAEMPPFLQIQVACPSPGEGGCVNIQKGPHVPCEHVLVPGSSSWYDYTLQ
eukprot:5279659-Amphidinium_carterae.1